MYAIKEHEFPLLQISLIRYQILLKFEILPAEHNITQSHKDRIELTSHIGGGGMVDWKKLVPSSILLLLLVTTHLSPAVIYCSIVGVQCTVFVKSSTGI